MKKITTVLLLFIISAITYAQSNDEFKNFIFKDLTKQSQDHHLMKIRDNTIAGFTLTSLSIIGVTQLTDLHGADQNAQSAIKPISVLAGGIGLLCFYYVGRHSFLYKKGLSPSSSSIGVSYRF
jgi:hypothetical protein